MNIVQCEVDGKVRSFDVADEHLDAFILNHGEAGTLRSIKHFNPFEWVREEKRRDNAMDVLAEIRAHHQR